MVSSLLGVFVMAQLKEALTFQRTTRWVFKLIVSKFSIANHDYNAESKREILYFPARRNTEEEAPPRIDEDSILFMNSNASI